MVGGETREKGGGKITEGLPSESFKDFCFQTARRKAIRRAENRMTISLWLLCEEQTMGSKGTCRETSCEATAKLSERNCSGSDQDDRGVGRESGWILGML